ncbi:hypothetical protein GLAREA_09126 [Glarea lozoyensis ATCC 20868]|uniref:Uncharacterized protein n=1 Tax=Glarea lozoyensis (strain ATCC 20868 / MF5171) TaxID=1116229 RepID=S3EFJ9_GLAL2|nr:uncharacterized protein GLAREA_09126 [Glarea lozoyensis ATCC 20868]EPE36963.1 hypothetical protein GLAREA_09126 [Glarea lozoyensis ATCC 20868]
MSGIGLRLMWAMMGYSCVVHLKQANWQIERQLLNAFLLGANNNSARPATLRLLYAHSRCIERLPGWVGLVGQLTYQPMASHARAVDPIGLLGPKPSPAKAETPTPCFDRGPGAKISALDGPFEPDA